MLERYGPWRLSRGGTHRSKESNGVLRVSEPTFVCFHSFEWQKLECRRHTRAKRQNISFLKEIYLASRAVMFSKSMLNFLLFDFPYCILYCLSRFEERIWPLWRSWETERHRAGLTATLATRTIYSETSKMLFLPTSRYFILRVS